MSMAVETQLVDFNALEREPSMERRGMLMDHVISLFSLTADRCPDDLLSIYDTVLLRLSEMVEVEARRLASEKLARLERAPHKFMCALAEDDIRVADPVLRHSKALTDDDLIRVADSKGRAHISAIAGRESLSPDVTDVVAHRGDDEIRRNLARNQGAKFGEVASRLIAEQVFRDEELQGLLVERDDIPRNVLAELVQHATSTVRTQLIEQGRFSELNQLDDAAKVAEERLSLDFIFDDCDFAGAEQAVADLERRGVLDELAVIRLAEQDDLAGTLCAFSRLCGVRQADVMSWVCQKQMEPLVVTARAYQFADSTVSLLLNVGKLKQWLTNDIRDVAKLRFDSLNPDTARRIMSYWNSDGH